MSIRRYAAFYQKEKKCIAQFRVPASLAGLSIAYGCSPKRCTLQSYVESSYPVKIKKEEATVAGGLNLL